MRKPSQSAAWFAGMLLLSPFISRADSTPPLARTNFAEYQQHLQQLSAIVHTCSAQLIPVACDPAQVGPDNEVVTSGGTRLVHYGWLREALLNAVKASGTSGKQADDAHAQLNAAAARLAQDSRISDAVAPAPSAPQVRANLTSILAERRFQRIRQDPSLLERARMALLNWIFERIGNVAAYGGRNPWIAHLLEGVAILTPCVLLTWWVIVRLRREAAAPRAVQPAALSAPSQREWQRWLEDAEGFARAGRWRDAIHHVYWAVISRLELHGLWPADRARTPREYLALLRAGNTLEPDLRDLTRSFELIWYGNRPAAEEQYREARARMDKLVPR